MLMMWHMPQSSKEWSGDGGTGAVVGVAMQALLPTAENQGKLGLRSTFGKTMQTLHCFSTRHSTDLLYVLLILWGQSVQDLL